MEVADQGQAAADLQPLEGEVVSGSYVDREEIDRAHSPIETTLVGGSTMSGPAPDLDPQEIVEQPGYVPPDADPTDPEVTDPADPSYVEPMGGVSMNLAPIIPGDGEVTA